MKDTIHHIIDTVVSQMPEILQKNPIIGSAGGAGAGILFWAELASPFLSFIGVCLGFGIAAITFHLKLIEWKEKRKTK